MVGINNSNSQKIVFDLMEKRKILETNLKSYMSILEKNNTNISESLVDSEGYPRSDIDVYQVRHARHHIICIKNDLKQIMGQIEKQLHFIHAENRENGNVRESDIVDDDSSIRALVRVDSVITNSPSDEAGLKNGDLITHFGSINSNNYADIKDLGKLVHNSVNQFIKVSIIRNNKIRKIYLKPRAWSGNGLLGCTLFPM